MLAFAFGTLHLRAVRAQANPENVASWRVVEKLGMRREAHRRGVDAAADGTWRDVYVYALDGGAWAPCLHATVRDSP